jgi:hypothetical protein
MLGVGGGSCGGGLGVFIEMGLRDLAENRFLGVGLKVKFTLGFTAQISKVNYVQSHLNLA